MRYFYSFVFLSLSYCSLYAQQPAGENALSRIDSIRTVIRERIEATRTNYNADSVRAIIENGPYFGVFKDNYFIGGIPVGQKIKADNSNQCDPASDKKQITVRHLFVSSVYAKDGLECLRRISADA